MSDDTIDPETMGERLAWVRRTYGESIDVPNLGIGAFAMLLGVPAAAYESYECGDREPPVDLLIALRNRTRISLDWFLDREQPAANRPLRNAGGHVSAVA